MSNTTVNQPGEAVESFLSGKLSQVDVRKIESELSRLWTQASGTGNDENCPQVIRACSSNLILYSNSDDAEISDANMLDAILQGHPSRAILAISRESDKPKLEAWVTARCHLAAGSKSKQICSEQITVLAEGPLENELVSVLESLVLGELPIFLWWTASDLSGDKIGPFLGACRRLIVDSSLAPYSFSFLRQLHQIVDSTLSCIAVSDLNWRRLLGIRAAIAEEFERKPYSIEALGRISKVRVSSCGQELQEDDCSLQALLLVGWLASRLEWDPISFAKEDGKGSTARFEKEEQQIEVEFKSVPMSHVSPGSIFEVEIDTTCGHSLRVSRDPSGEVGSLVVIVKENDKRIRELLADDSNLERVNLMGYELEEQKSDNIFAQSLEKAFDLVHLLEQ